MKNIIRSQFYQIMRTRFLFIIVIGSSLIPIILLCVQWMYLPDYSASSFLAENLYTISLCALMITAVIAAFACTDDLSDKNINYELMSGHLRRHSYFGKAIPVLAVSVGAGTALMLVAVIAACIKLGWGNAITAGDLALRLLLLVISLIRISCFCIFLSFIMKKAGTVGGILYGAIMAAGILYSTSEHHSTVLTSTFSLKYICHFDSWYTYKLLSPDIDVRYVYESALYASDTVLYIIVPLIMAAAYLLLGYVFFRKDDLE